VTLLITDAAMVHAQSGDEAPTARFRSGPLSLTPTIVLSSIGLDDNVFNEATDPKSDFTAAAQPGLTAWLRVGRSRLTWSGRADAVFFKRYSSQSTLGTAQSVRFDLPINRVRIFVTDTFLNARERPSLDIDTRVRRTEKTVGGGIDVELTTRTKVALTAQRGVVAFDEGASVERVSLANALDRRVDQFGISVNHALTPLTALTAAFSTGIDAFHVDRLRDSRRRRLGIGLEFKPLALVAGHVDVGVLDFRPSDARLPALRAPAVGADVGYTFGGVTHCSVRIDRGVSYSVEDASAYYLQTGVAVGLVHYVRENLDVAANVARQRLDYRSTSVALIGVGSITARPQTTVTLYDAGIGYHVTPGVRWGMHVAYSTRDTHAGTLGGYRNVRMYASVGYGMR
jgi:hypothetical protein